MSEVDVVARGSDRLEIVALLAPTAAVVAELDAVVAEVAATPGVADASRERSEPE